MEDGVSYLILEETKTTLDMRDRYNEDVRQCNVSDSEDWIYNHDNW